MVLIKINALKNFKHITFVIQIVLHCNIVGFFVRRCHTTINGGKHMVHLSVKIPDYLHQQLEAKIHEMELPSMSDVVRILLSAALEKTESANAQNDKIQHKILHNVVTCYYLLKEQMVHTEEGLERDRTAHERSKKAMEKILKQTQPDY